MTSPFLTQNMILKPSNVDKEPFYDTMAEHDMRRYHIHTYVSKADGCIHVLPDRWLQKTCTCMATHCQCAILTEIEVYKQMYVLAKHAVFCLP